jgi:hypothetical protein
MDRNCQSIGFLGIDKYEYILYLSRVLYHLGKKVLLVDCSETGALTSSIPRPKAKFNSEIEYRGVMFFDQQKSNDNPYGWSEVIMGDKEYDYVLIDYGFGGNTKELAKCSQLVFVTDQQAHNIHRLRIPDDLKHCEKYIIIKNYVKCRITPSYILSELTLDYLSANQIYIADQDELDLKCKINYQYEGTFHFRKLSTQTKSIIKGLLIKFCPEITKKQIKEVCKKVERGVWKQ